MTRLQHFGWFFSRGFGPQGWGHPAHRWNYRWTEPALYQQSVRELEQAGLDLVIIEDAPSMGTPDTLDVRVRNAYGAPKHDPLALTPYLLAATQHIGIAPTINTGVYPPYVAARHFASLHHLSGHRVGLNVVTDIPTTRLVGAPPVTHDQAYDRAGEWLRAVRGLWHSWEDGALIEDAAAGRFADATRIRADRFEGEYFDVSGPLNAVPFTDGDPAIVSPGGSPRGLAFAGAHSDVQLAYAPLDLDKVRAYRQKIIDAALAEGRAANAVKTLFVFKPEIVASEEEVDRVVAASLDPSEDVLAAILEGQSSDLETDLTGLGLDEPIDPAIFGEHVSQGTIRGLLGQAPSFSDATLRELIVAKSRKGRIDRHQGFVGTAAQVADFVEEFGEEADNDGFIFSGDLHPVTVHRYLDELVPVLRRRGLLRDEYGGGGIQGNLHDF